MHLTAETPRIRDYAFFLSRDVVSDFGLVLDQASSQGCNTSGFTGVLAPVQEAMKALNELTVKAYQLAVDRLDSTAAGTEAAANAYDHIENINVQHVTSAAQRLAVEVAAGADSTRGSKGVGPGYRDVKTVTPTKIVPGTENLIDKLKGDSRWLGDAVDWCYRNFLSHLLGTPGKGLYDVLLTPIAGDFNRINANGEAWGDVGDMIQDIAKNMGDNASDLTQHHWTGPAADAFYQHIDLAWTGALTGVSGIAFALKKGFAELAKISIKIAGKCADLLEKILEKIVSLAKYVIPEGFPGSGAVMAAVEWAAEGFDKDKVPFYGEVIGIVNAVNGAIKLYDTIQKIARGFQNYIRLAEDIARSLEQIPHVRSNAGAINIATDLKQDTDAAKDQKKKLDGDLKNYNKQIDGWRKSSAPATQ